MGRAKVGGSSLTPLQELRQEIDQIDLQIISLLEKRFATVMRMRPYKIAVEDKKREEEILSRIASAPIQKVYHRIFAVAKELQ